MNSLDEADAIRRRMQAIRHDLHTDVDDISHRAGRLVDWRHYPRNYPWMSMITGAVVGCLMIPRLLKWWSPLNKSRLPPVRPVAPPLQAPPAAPQPAPRKHLGGQIASSLATVAVRVLTAFVVDRVGAFLQSQVAPPMAKENHEPRNRHPLPDQQLQQWPPSEKSR